jgi:GH25 family lysozyme M1 (1,4-beta-N-acetylmuramidase)
MIYCNMLWEAYKLDLGELNDYPVWYADYEKLPQTPYAFTFWQYSESAHVDGIPEAVDTDIWLTQ